MTAKERRQLKDIGEQVNSLSRALSDLQAHQLHTQPYRCPYCHPYPGQSIPTPFYPQYPKITSTWIGTTAPPQMFDFVTVDSTVTSGHITSDC